MDFQEFIKRFPIRLNKQQQEAVQAVRGPVLLLAVPGSGKTTVLVARLGYMILARGIDPAKILTLTYTVAATKDMKVRFTRIFGEEWGNRVQFHTINSICAGVLNTFGRMTGKTPYELESDERVLLQILSGLYQRYEDGYPTESDLKSVKQWITYIKNMMLTDREIKERETEAGCHLLEIYKGYCREMNSRRRIDFDDQMVYAYRLLKQVPDLLKYYQELFPYICVDEAQDTSKIQHEIIRLLSSGSDNLFMVGDEDQSIYGFRAAYPEALLDFEKQHKNAKVLLMEDNFRSNSKIVEAADAFIQQNTLRHKKKMRATKPAGPEIREVQMKNRGAQYSYLLQVANGLSVAEGDSLAGGTSGPAEGTPAPAAGVRTQETTAVLYRDNESAIPLIDLFEREGKPYRIRNAELSFFTNRVVTDLVNIMKLSLNPKDTESFEKIYYKVASYLTKQNAMKCSELSAYHGISVWSAALTGLDLKSYTRSSIKAMETHFNNMRQDTPDKAINRIMHYMGYVDYLERQSIDDSKVFILRQIAKREATIESFLNRLEELKTLIQTKENDYTCPFILSTIHSSKGLEYTNVYLIDVTDGVFPESVPTGRTAKQMKKEELETYEEERRLFYVGVTRAKNTLTILKAPGTSSFVNQLLKGERAFAAKSQVKKKDNLRKEKNSQKNFSKMKYKGTSSDIIDDSSFDEALRGLTEGQVVTHKKYGEGVIIGFDNPYVYIRFDQTKKAFNLVRLVESGALKFI